MDKYADEPGGKPEFYYGGSEPVAPTDRPGIESRDRVILECGCAQCKSDEPLVVWIRHLEAAIERWAKSKNRRPEFRGLFTAEEKNLFEIAKQFPK